VRVRVIEVNEALNRVGLSMRSPRPDPAGAGGDRGPRERSPQARREPRPQAAPARRSQAPPAPPSRYTVEDLKAKFNRKT
jgi:hypothetical protein